MLYPSSEAFQAEPHKRITLMGMSNVGKTRAGSSLPRTGWFHYSVDYRLATAYLRDDIIDTLKVEMMRNPKLARQLRDDAISVDINVAFSNLSVLSHYLGMLGDPAVGGLAPGEFRRRQARHRAAEIAAMGDVQKFIAKGRDIYGYPHFLNDASGSLCELIDLEDPQDPVLRAVLDNTVLVYIMADTAHEEGLIRAAQATPKPLYFRPEFLDEVLAAYASGEGGETGAGIEPHDFARWVFPKLLDARRPRFESIARHGYVIDAHALAASRGENEFLRLVGDAIDHANQPAGLNEALQTA